MIFDVRVFHVLLQVAAISVCVGLLSACSVEHPELSKWQGAYRWGHEVNSFCPCGSQKCYWVRASDQLQLRLRHYVEQSKAKPYQPVYLQMRAKLLDVPGRGFAEDYDTVIQVESLISMDVSLPQNC